MSARPSLMMHRGGSTAVNSAWRRFWSSSFAAVVLLNVAGCGGCWQTTASAPPKSAEELEKQRVEEAERQRKEREEAAKPDYELLQFRTRPSSLVTVDNSTKPGHWASATMDARANRDDFNGVLSVLAVDMEGEPLPLAGTNYSMDCVRPVQLAKKQPKNLELTYFAPLEQPSLRLESALSMGLGGRPVQFTRDVVTLMPEHQYHFVVLTDTPSSYSFVNVLPTIKAPSALPVDSTQARHYRVAVPQVKTYVPLASSALKWTTVAYIVWDDFSPNKLQPQQQEALIDWLHWGGNLIISGPKSLDTLKTSFLDPYLPAESQGSRDLDQSSLDVLNQQFRRRGPELVVKKAWSGVSLKVRPQGAFVDGSDELVAERRVGTGRIAVTAFSLAQRELRSWPGLDELVNSWLMRRAARVFALGPAGTEATVRWANQNQEFPPELVTNVRLFTRDFQTSQAELAAARERSAIDGIRISQAQGPFGYGSPNDFGGADVPVGPGVAAWNDRSDVAIRAGEALRTAAGIKVPKREFVLWVLGSYVLVLAPLNWAVFRIARHVEWAWLAVPVLAVGFSIGVIRLAQLDIGFARSMTELSVLEVQGDHSRAHLTRYTALYTSLATNYDLEFADSSALALPLAGDADTLTGNDVDRVNYWRDSTARLTDFTVQSNSTGLVHSEQMFDLGGPIRWLQESGQWVVVNDSEYALRGAAVIGPDGLAWVGDLAVRAKKPVTFVDRPSNARDISFDERNASPETARGNVPGRLSVRPLVQVAERSSRPDETRLVAWTEQEMPGLSVDPPSPQQRRLTVVVAHLDYGPYGTPDRDTSGWLDVVDARNLRFVDPNEVEEEEN